MKTFKPIITMPSNMVKKNWKREINKLRKRDGKSGILWDKCLDFSSEWLRMDRTRHHYLIITEKTTPSYVQQNQFIKNTINQVKYTYKKLAKDETN